ncbi:MAG: hypothetical protein DIU69_05740 [Bacillota bacterium]|nr:MAG: hypothetical protein DIU69_05740 [Bacillota bacterium]
MGDRWRRWLRVLAGGARPVGGRVFSRFPAGVVAAPAGGEADFDWVAAVDEARREWEHARRYFETVTDEDLVDQAIHLVNAAEKRYAYLLKQIRRQGVRAASEGAVARATPRRLAR